MRVCVSVLTHVSACIRVSAPHCRPPPSIWSAVTQGDGGALHGADTSSHIDDNPPCHNKLNVSRSSICKTRQIMNYCYSGLFTPSLQMRLCISALHFCLLPLCFLHPSRYLSISLPILCLSICTLSQFAVVYVAVCRYLCCKPALPHPFSPSLTAVLLCHCTAKMN